MLQLLIPLTIWKTSILFFESFGDLRETVALTAASPTSPSSG
jgi:hypothetical protein